jgi:hypothetical protein
MHVWSVLTARPKPVLPRSQRLVSLAGLFVLAVLLVGHSVALSVFMWQPGAGTKVVVLLGFSWAISMVGVWLVLRFVRAVWSMPESAQS